MIASRSEFFNNFLNPEERKEKLDFGPTKDIY